MPEIIVVMHNIRSTHNVGAVFRTSEGLGIQKIICSGYTPYPKVFNDPRLPHIAEKLTSQIHKTALGAEELVPFEYHAMPPTVQLKNQGYILAGLEQDTRSTTLPGYTPPQKIALLLGEEVDGIDSMLRDQCDVLLEIPMHGQKESFNVSVAAGMALYQLRFK